MVGGSEEREVGARLARLEAENRVLRADLDSTRIGVLSWSTVIAVIFALALPMFDIAEPDPLSTDTDVAVSGPASVSLFGLAGQAGDVSNGTVEAFSIVAIIALVALGLSAALALRGPRRWFVLAAAGLLGLSWFLLVIAVGSSGDGGAVGDLGYSNTLRVVALPIVAALGVAAGVVAGDVER